jgi:hypothetical protein
MITANEFFTKVMHGLPTEGVPARVMAANEGFILQLFQRGWSVEDARAYVQCFEEFSPELSEEDALERMAVLDKKHPVK